MALAWGKQLLLFRLRSAEKDAGLIPEDNGTKFTVEVDIPSQAVAKLTGTSRKEQVKKETGADMYLYTQTKQDEYPFVRLRGSADQVESAFECVCDEVARVDIRFARRMLARSALVAESRQVGWIKGTNGVKLEKLEKDTNAKVRVEPFSKQKETQDITITGTVMEVYAAYEKIQESLESYDPDRAKKAIRVPVDKEEEKKIERPDRQSSTADSKNVGNKNDSSMLAASPQKPHGFSREAPKEADVTHTKHSSKLMQCKLTIKARPLLFACLLGKAQENIRKIRESTTAIIHIGPQTGRQEFQDVYIEGDVFETLKAARLVKASLERFDPNHPGSVEKIKDSSLELGELKEMKGQASLTIAQHLSGYFVGRKFCNINRIKEETKVDQLSVPDNEDSCYKSVEISGDLDSAIEALEKSAEWIKNFKPKNERSEQQHRSQEKKNFDQSRPNQSKYKAPKAQEKERRTKPAETSPKRYPPTQPSRSPPHPNVTQRTKPADISAKRYPQTQPPRSSPHSNVTQRTQTNSKPTTPMTRGNVRIGPHPSSTLKPPQTTYQQQSVQMSQPQPQQPPVQALGQQTLQSSNTAVPYIILQPVTGNGQEQVPLQQAYILQPASEFSQHPQQVGQQATPALAVRGVPGQAVAFKPAPPSHPSQAVQWNGVPCMSAPPPPPPLRPPRKH